MNQVKTLRLLSGLTGTWISRLVAINMKMILFFAVLFMCTAYPATAAPTVVSLLDQADQGGSGATAKTVSSSETFDTDANSIFYFTSFTVAPGQTLSATGSNPLVIVADTIDVQGTIDVSGEDGHNATSVSGGGKGAAGGAGGGAMLLIGRTHVVIHSGGILMANGGHGGHAGGKSQASFEGNPWYNASMASDGLGGVGVAGG